MNSLISKYNIPVPRYTSYPTVPYWDNTPDQEQWKSLVKESFKKTNDKNGISLYIHLPFCESLCTYCACNTRITVNHKVEEPYIKSLLKEWQLYLNIFEGKPKIKEIHLGGGTPTFFSPDNLKKLINAILNSSIITKDAEFSFEAHPNNTSKEHLQTLYDLGFRRVSYGIQDFDPIVQDAINRVQTFEQVKTAVDNARNIGYTSINFDLIYGLPFQTVISVINTINKVNLLKPDRIAFYSYAHVPWVKPGQRKFGEKDLPVDIKKRQLYEKGLELFKQSGYTDIGMDHFALPDDTLYSSMKNKALHRNFMGYTHNYTELMIGLGASSISDTWNAFGQNIKTVEEYQEAVNNGKFPITKGHILSTDDLCMRKHILNIMCKGETQWVDKDLNSLKFNETLYRLEELKADNLVEIKQNKLSVTELGKAFLRNICLCFDSKYWAKVSNKTIFSSAV